MTRRRRGWLIVLAALVVLYVALAGGFFAAILQSPERFGRIMASVPEPLLIVMAILPVESMWNVARDGDLAVGDVAPDFELAAPRGHAASEEEPATRVRLSSFRGHQPVVLVFGSYT